MQVFFKCCRALVVSKGNGKTSFLKRFLKKRCPKHQHTQGETNHPFADLLIAIENFSGKLLSLKVEMDMQLFEKCFIASNSETVQ